MKRTGRSLLGGDISELCYWPPPFGTHTRSVMQSGSNWFLEKPLTANQGAFRVHLGGLVRMYL